MYPSGALPVASVIASASSIRAAAAANSSGVHVHACAICGREREEAERAGVAGELQLAGRQLVPRLVLPKIRCDAAREPEPANVVLAVALVSGYRVQRLPERRHAGRVAVGEASRQSVEEEVDRSCRLRGHGVQRGRPLQRLVPRGRCRDGRRRSPLRALQGTSRAPTRRSMVQGVSQRRAKAAERRCPRLSAKASCARSRSRRARWSSSSGPLFSNREQLQRRGRAHRPHAWPALRSVHARARCAGSGVSVAARSRNAAAAARPPRARARSAERSSSAATSSSGARAACARCHARRSGSTLGSVAAARADARSAARRRCRAVDRRAQEGVAKGHPGADRRAGPPFPPDPPPSGPRPRRSAAPPQERRITDWFGRGDQQQSLAVRGEELDSLPEAQLDPTRQRKRGVNGEAARQLGRGQPVRQLEERERIATRFGDESLAHALVQRPGDAPRQATRVRGCPSAPRAVAPAARRGASNSPGSRSANTRTIESASKRRATNASTCAEERSSHCASSIRQRRGSSSAASERRLSSASPTRNRSGRAPALRPKAVPSASRWGGGSRARPSSRGAHNWWTPANGSSISDSTPIARRTRQPSARPAA